MNNQTQQTVTIEGMTCGSCEKIVAEKIRAIEGVLDAIVSKDNGTAIISSTRQIPNDELTQALADTHYHIITNS